MRAVIDKTVTSILDGARSEGRNVLLDPEGFALLDVLDIAVPRHHLISSSADITPHLLSSFPGDRIVIKVITDHILHKTDLGGVLTVPREPSIVEAAVQTMERRFRAHEVSGFTINEYVHHDAALGAQLLLGMRWTNDFGPVVTLGPGGIYAEYLAKHLRPGRAMAIFSPELTPDEAIESILSADAVAQLVTGRNRGRNARISPESLYELLRKFLDFAASRMPHDVTDFEINPLVLTDRKPIALDVLVKLGDGLTLQPDTRPIHKIKNLLEPQSIAIVGVSQSQNPGHMILHNIIRSGFDPDRIHLVKPGNDQIEGVQCYPSITSLPGTIDLFVVSVAAALVPEIIQEVIGSEKAESMIVIPGGLGERSGSEGLEQGVRFALAEARKSEWQGPVINGGNCLGIRSAPGRYDSTFLPEHKVRPGPGRPAPLAIISQSGAFAAARSSRLANLDPRYVISVGNQSDLTVGDYLSYLKDDQEVEVFACYVEGFRPLDGRQWMAAAAEITASGRSVILYRAGRTAAGASATESHTASIAGDYSVTRELAAATGVLVADSLGDFDDLTRLACYLNNCAVAGWRLGAISNAGFECVAIADSVGRFYLPAFSPATTEHLSSILGDAGIDSVVGVQNPLDLTPIMSDELYAAATGSVLEDNNIDVGIVGCVPMTGALNTLGEAEIHDEDLKREGSLVTRLAQLKQDTSKAWVAVVEGGTMYDPMAATLEAHEIPTFRTADRAMRMFEMYCRSRIKRTVSQTSSAEQPRI
ncbi:MAG: acetate--CoA ligase family protein [Gemmatimonadota bacterium]|nr:MAG: acetate--CoA ligase family protein [Gemmatimonadota bacterium]